MTYGLRRSDVANTRYLTTMVEEHVRAALSEQYGVKFVKRVLPLVTPGHHEFDAVAVDGSIVASIKSSGGKTSGGRHPGGKVQACIAELYFLTLVEAPRRQLILTTPEFYDIFMRTLRDKVAPGIEVVHAPLPPDVQAEVTAVQKKASDEMFTVLDPNEQQIVEEL